MTSPRIVVSGAGPAGLAFARFASRSKSLGNVTVIEISGEKRSRDRGLGLWPASTRMLRESGVDVDQWRKIPPACYRNSQGDVLSRCSERYAGAVRSTLQSTLVASILSGCNVDLLFETSIARVSQQGKALDITLTRKDGQEREIQADLLVIADGHPSSTARLLGGTATNAERSGCVVNGILRRSADAISGTRFERCGFLPYETLIGAGKRFAVVPLSESELFWFATLQDVSAAIAENDPLGTVLGVLKDSHSPNTAIVQATSIEDVFVQGSVESGERAVLADSVQDRVISIGDAATAIPHNLAQGASLGIEDAALLAHALEKDASIGTCLEEYQKLREPRHRNCRLFTAFTEMISRFPQAFAPLMQITPPEINQRVFDASLERSMSSSDPRGVHLSFRDEIVLNAQQLDASQKLLAFAAKLYPRDAKRAGFDILAAKKKVGVDYELWRDDYPFYDRLFGEAYREHWISARAEKACARALSKGPGGVYLWGSKDSGKTTLLESLHSKVSNDVAVVSMPFGNWIEKVHRDASERRRHVEFKKQDPLPAIVAQLSRDADLYIFDDFDVANVADAMILRRVFEGLLGFGVGIVLASDVPLENLYVGRPSSERFSPCKALLRQALVDVHL